jgi:nucleoside-diphosphate kinase
MERTLVLLKPDCVQRRMIGRLLARFEDKGLYIVAMKLMKATADLARRHYAEHLEKPFYPGLEAFITGGPLVAMIVEGPEVIEVVRNRHT